MAALAGYKGDVYIIDDSGAFSAAFTTEATTESGVTRQYTIDAAYKYWDHNEAVTVTGYWAFQEFALDTTSGADSGLASTTQYYFKIAIDGGSVTEYDITTGGGTVTWANVVTLIDTAITGDGATAQFIDGDVRIHSDDVTASSDITCSAGTTGTSLFGQGSVPAVADLETIDYTDIAVDTVGFGTQGIAYATGIVQMNYTGFTSLEVTGKYHTLKQAGQFQSYGLTVNINSADITDFQDSWKANTSTTKSSTLTLDGFYASDQYFVLNANGIVIIRLYNDYDNTQGYYFYGISSQTISGTPHEVIRESLSFEGVGVLEYFSS